MRDAEKTTDEAGEQSFYLSFSAVELNESAALGGDVRLDLSPRTTVLVGKNGAGKSLLLEKILALSAALLLLLLPACNPPSPDAAARPAASAEAPRLLLPEMNADAVWWLNGPPAPLAAARGSVVLIDAWERLCATCVASVPAVLALKSRYEARGLQVVSVTAFDDAPGEREIVAASAREARMTYPCFLDKGSVWQHAAGTSGMIPMFLVVDRGGRLAFSAKGLLAEGTPAFEGLAAAIERALAGS